MLAPPKSHRRHWPAIAVVALVLACASAAPAAATATGDQETAKKPRGLIVNTPAAAPGYTLYAPLELQRTYLLARDGTVAHTWKTSTQPGLIQYLLPNGHLLRAGNLKTLGVWAEGRGAGGRVEQLDWDGKQVWKYDVADDNAMQHHDIEPLPNGNVLILAWERKTGAEALAAGRNPKLLSSKELWPEKIIEYSPATGTVVWEWHVWDHVVQERDPTLANYGDVSAHPEKINLNYVLPGSTGDADWNHAERGRLQRRARPDHDQLPLLQRALDHRPRCHHRGSARSGGRSPVPLRESRGVRQGRHRSTSSSSSNTTRTGFPRAFRARARSSCSATDCR